MSGGSNFNPSLVAGDIIPIPGSSLDIGSALNPFDTIYVNNIVPPPGGGIAGWIATNNPGVSSFFECTEPLGEIRADTVDGADNLLLFLAGGGAIGVNRGSHIYVSGNESTEAGTVAMVSGNTATSQLVLQALTSGSSTRGIKFLTDSTMMWQIYDISSPILRFNGASGLIAASTSDGGDTAYAMLAGGGGFGVGRGGHVIAVGNEEGATSGSVSLIGGNVALGHIVLETSHASAVIQAKFNTVEQWRVDGTGVLTNKNAAFETTGAGAALLGANSPAGTLAAPNTWLTFTKSDGTPLFVPAWA